MNKNNENQKNVKDKKPHKHPKKEQRSCRKINITNDELEKVHGGSINGGDRLVAEMNADLTMIYGDKWTGR